MIDLPGPITTWFAERGWRLRRHQAEMIAAARRGDDALLVAATGAGKTLAGFLASIAELIEKPDFDGLHTLYISPLKALAVDVQRNLLEPIQDMGLDIRVETRTGDTPSNRKARQRTQPPQMLLTTPESLSLLLSYPEAEAMFAGLRTIIVDEIHAFAPTKRGDLLSLAMARLQALSPQLRRVALTATVRDPDGFRGWLSSDGDYEGVTLVEGEPGAKANIRILLPEDRVPWSGHSGRYAARQVMEEIAAHKLTLVFCNTRGLAELIFQDLWAENDGNLPIAVHHGSLSVEARRKVEGAMARGDLRGLVCTASLDLGVDWGDVDLVVQMGAPKGSSRLLQRIGRANHRLDEASEAIIVPGNRFEYLEARAALDAVAEGELDPDIWRSGGLDVLAQHVMAVACAAPFSADDLYREVRTAAPYALLTRETFDAVLHFVESGGYALRAYDKYRRITRGGDGLWRISHPRFAAQHRLNAGIIVDAPVLDVRFRNGRKLGTVEEYFASTLRPGDSFSFAGVPLEVVGVKDADLLVKATAKPARIPTYVGARMPLTTNLSRRVRHFLHEPDAWQRFPQDVREWLQMQRLRSVLPAPDELLVETFPRDDRHYMIAYSFEGWNAHQSLGMLITRRMETQGLSPLGFVSNDYALACYSLKPVTDPRPLFSADILEDELVEWIQTSALLKRAFREVAVIGGLIERHIPGKRKTGRQVTFSTDLIYDVLRKYEPDHMLLNAAWEDAKGKLTDIGRLADLLERAPSTMVHQRLDRISPLAVPIMVLIGRESVASGTVEDEILAEAERLAAEAMRPG
ncbi:ligase-associated DNA damage response DEXH box helicase [Pacificimonas sp. WHA3]|uniref:Ligase-associated DNA damage response DEXH box helicase n=1 Tax=Pacificimonas pallii TaxID=2827236 RepID=A0ABS6SGS5_9SPHN|nr:ligase-associated DNA damage response DEXH box helicase [Pacificimonas pallii]MBV7257460.1 ligase-associated DNA damage response DEXH box helicase [Pacificimonas pallii]